MLKITNLEEEAQKIWSFDMLDLNCIITSSLLCPQVILTSASKSYLDTADLDQSYSVTEPHDLYILRGHVRFQLQTTSKVLQIVGPNFDTFGGHRSPADHLLCQGCRRLHK
jgi:hypothetical protein